MHRNVLVLSFAMALIAACGAPPEPTIGTRSGLNGFSVPPPGGWGLEPWICSGPVGSHPAWVPTNHPWPIDTTNGWCQWMPTPNAGIYPYHVWACDPGDPTHNGSMQIYSENNYGGDCALIWGGDTAHPLDPYMYDADLVEVNGWHSIWTPVGGTQQFKGIKSIKIGPYTSAYFCEGPFTGPPGAPCNLYPSSASSNNNPTSVNWPQMLWNNGLFFETAAIQLQALR